MVFSIILDTTVRRVCVLLGYSSRLFKIGALVFQSFIDQEIKVTLKRFTRLHRSNAKTSAPSFKNFEDILFKTGAFHDPNQAKIFLIISSVTLHNSKL